MAPLLTRRDVLLGGAATAGIVLLPRPLFAETARTNGTMLGPSYGLFSVEMESSSQRCIKLESPGNFVELTVQVPANALVIRYSLPDSPQGDGIDAGLDLYRNGKLLRTIPITSRYSWLYGAYPFSNDPAAGKPRNFYDECRVKDLDFAEGDVIRLQKRDDAAGYCIIDLVDFETAAPPLPQPANSLAFSDFGADTEALRACIAEAARQGKSVWVPPGDYKLTGEIVLPPDMTLQGAGMWHTNFVGDADLYNQPDRRVKFVLKGGNNHLSDFAIIGKLTYRNDQEANDGIVGEQAENFTIARLWVEHTKSGMWFYGCANGVIEDCRLRNTRADGINICTHSHHLLVSNCTARNTGDDCFAIWPAAFDHAHGKHTAPGANIIRNCTGELPYLANGGAIYGGADNRIETCRFTDIAAGCGILISTTFPTADPAYGIDYNFSGTTVIQDCELLRCGGYDHEWAWRAALQICLDHRDISGLHIGGVTIRDSLSDGFGIVGHHKLIDAHLDIAIDQEQKISR